MANPVVRSAALAALALVLLVRPARAEAPDPFAGAPDKPCAAYPSGQNPTARKVYLLPKVGQPANEVACSVVGMAIAVHDGNFRTLYGPEYDYQPREHQPIRRIISQSVSYLRDQARQRYEQDRASACPPGPGDCQVTLKVLIFAHGGMVAQESGVGEAETMAPGMMADGYTPLFLIWNSDLFGAYGERLCCVLEGEQSKRLFPYFAPARLLGDLLASGARAPEYFGQQLLRFDDSVIKGGGTQYYLSPDDIGTGALSVCGALGGESCPQVIYPPFKADRFLNAKDEPPAVQGAAYRLLFGARFLTTMTLPQIGAEAWDDMVRRTRLALQSPMVEVGGRATLKSAGMDPCEEETRTKIDRLATTVDAADGHASASRFAPTTEGGFAMFFDRLSCENKEGQLAFKADGRQVHVDLELYYYGHSMGAIVGDELILSHPELPWKRIVYLAAAASVRDFRSSVVPLLTSKPDLHFYNVMLHPLAESHDLEMGGIVPEGSLLEWIDEMFGGAKSVDDRMLGKWTNAEKTMPLFPPAVRSKMTFHVLPAQAVMKDRAKEEGEAYAQTCTSSPSDAQGAHVADPPRCHPITHGEFTQYAFWRDDFLCGSIDTPLGDGLCPAPSAPPPPEP